MPDFSEIDKARRLLGLGEMATLKEIKSAYRRLAHRHHPDKHSSTAAEETEETMKRLNEAYKLLMDYCSNYRYGFREEDVARTYPYDDYLGQFRDKWFDSI